ncbi:hypothetical protein CI109_102077 [Kwoniella shandongensis]|uniref:Uncharacterized protein n=1 Tax=Kwoniella shandongensis TaxID=1734106 RepID=A0A5M6BU93_9TREE|nr:uncharacterized protein CI109_006515 [Kwoniella shandongensis]KAA5525145.1 hypothetical protein CI109_006515 [Kwoniella shandongensis]
MAFFDSSYLPYEGGLLFVPQHPLVVCQPSHTSQQDRPHPGLTSQNASAHRPAPMVQSQHQNPTIILSQRSASPSRLQGNIPIPPNQNATASLTVENTRIPSLSTVGSPPSYALLPMSSPPGYKPLPSSSDLTILLAPPPPFYQATCPHADSPSPSHTSPHGGGILPSHSCPYCFRTTSSHDSGRERERERGKDWMVTILVVLNIIVWGAVIYGYYCEFTTLDSGAAAPGGGDWKWGPPGGGEWTGAWVRGKNMVEDCSMVSVDC